MRAALSVGANLGDRTAALDHAVSALRALPGVSSVRVSDTFETDPVGGVDQPDFLNLVAVAEFADTDPEAVAWRLLTLAREVETDLDRVRDIRWGPRTVDVDVLAVGDWRSQDPELTVPHPRAAERAFVLVPWALVDPDFVVPGPERTVAQLCDALPEAERAGVRRMPRP